MFRKMRREKCELSKETAEKILRTGDFGVLALSGDNGYSYAVPINYAYSDKQRQVSEKSRRYSLVHNLF